MEKFAKFIIIACISALILVFFLVIWFFPQPVNFSKVFEINNFLPFNLDKGKNPVVEVKKRQDIKMLFLGDIMLDRHVKEKIAGQGVSYLFQGLKNDKFDFFKYDIVNANLEGAVTNGGSHYPPIFSYDFAFAPEVMEKFKDYNFNSFNLANNHLSDQGERGLNETRANLAKLNFQYYGCEDGQAGDCSFKIYKVNGVRIGLVGFSMVYKKFDQEKAKNLIADLETKADLVIINIHWGTEYSHVFNKIQEDTAHKLIDAGADIIIGHHPHVVQGIEIYNNKPIFYSLGNFIFDQYFSRDTQEELAVELNLEASGQAKVIFYPLISKQSQPSLMADTEKEKYLREIAGWSKGDDKLLEQIKNGEILINF